MRRLRNLINLFLLALIFFLRAGPVPAQQNTTVITWLNPTKQHNNQKSVKANIRATIKSPSQIGEVSVYLNDVLYGTPEMESSPTEPGAFIVGKALNLEPGDNSIFIIVTNKDGSTTSEKRYYTIPQPVEIKSTDSVMKFMPGPPSIEWVTPSAAKTTLRSTRASITANVKSNSQISQMSLYCNDVLYGSPDMDSSPTELATFIVTKTLNLEPGENSIFLVVANTEGTTTSEKRFFTTPVSVAVKTAESTILKSVPGSPVITWLSPLGTTSTLRSSRASIRATVKSNSQINQVSLYLNNVLYGAPEMESSPKEPGAFIVSKTLNLEPGENILYLVAVNNEGTTTSQEKYFTVPPGLKAADSALVNPQVLPVITWTVPEEKSITLKSASTNIIATIKSAPALKSVVLYLNGNLLGELDIKPDQNEAESFIVEKNINFRQVENSIYLEVNYNGGSSKSTERSFICPPSALLASQSTNQLPNSKSNQQSSNQIAEKSVETVKTEKPAVRATTTAVAVSSVAAFPAVPVITWTSPSGSHTTLDSFTGTVKANIKSKEGLKSVLLYVNGVSKGGAEVISNPGDAESFLMEKTINFGPGENNIYIVATSSQGTSVKSEVRYFTNPAAAEPVINWTNPVSPSSMVNEESFRIGACIKSPTELRSVRLLVNGVIQSEDNVFQASGNDECNYNWQGSVVLKDGDNSIYIIATNIVKSIQSEKRVIKYSQAIAEKRMALVIGNAQYRNKAALKNPANDANLMEGTLKELGFDVSKYLDVDKDKMMSAIREFNEKLPDYNVALFYFAGHGIQVDGKNFLIPTDANLEKPGDCKYDAVDLNDVLEEFEKYQDNTNILILDACRSNPFATWTRGGDAGVKIMPATSGTIIGFATSAGTTAADGKSNNGLYTEELVKQMVIPQSIYKVFMNTRVNVRKLSNNQQIPSEDNKLNGDFFLKK